MTDDWAPTRALRRAVGMTLLLLVGAVLLGRPDLVVLAAPFALGTALALRRRPTLLPDATVATTATYVVEGDPVDVAVTVVNPDDARFDLAIVRSRPRSRPAEWPTSG